MIKDQAYGMCMQLTIATLGEGLEELGELAFGILSLNLSLNLSRRSLPLRLRELGGFPPHFLCKAS